MDENELLDEVLTPSEVVQLYGINLTTVHDAMHANTSPLVARKSGNRWIITRASVERRWGKPRGTPALKRHCETCVDAHM